MAETKAVKKPKGTGTTITLNFANDPDVLAGIRKAATEDRRSESQWLLIELVKQYEAGTLFAGE